jgi:hypothetical protein
MLRLISSVSDAGKRSNANEDGGMPRTVKLPLQLASRHSASGHRLERLKQLLCRQPWSRDASLEDRSALLGVIWIFTGWDLKQCILVAAAGPCDPVLFVPPLCVQYNKADYTMHMSHAKARLMEPG